MTTFLSGEPKMYEAYNNGRDLYAIIAQAAFHNNYEDNLEFYPEGYEIEIDGKKLVSGSGKTFDRTTDENDTITVKYYELLETSQGDISAQDLSVGDVICSDKGDLIIIDKIQDNKDITFKFSIK